MPDLMNLDPATVELLFSSTLSVALLASAAMAIASLPWSDQEIAQVDETARKLAAAPARRVVALSRQVIARP